jgi:ElaB/YqjD/DUF883 family membrane-anchored ribosome-binding protein
MSSQSTHNSGRGANEVKDSANRVANEAKDKATESLQSLKDLGSQAKTVAQDQLQRASQVAQEQMETIRDSASEYYEQGLAKAEELRGTVENRIQQTPLQSVMIAAGVGFVLGIILTRR